MKHNVIEMGAILARLVGLMAGALISIKLIFLFFFLHKTVLAMTSRPPHQCTVAILALDVT